ncbi:MAG TPA: polysaccharide deacetylase family protein [Verrucomicrobiae bacterium]|nr:polysaccharide deacetylase family protein [Verrucomicrobiae bacterium]
MGRKLRSKIAAALLMIAAAMSGGLRAGQGQASPFLVRDGGIIRGPQNEKRIAIVFTGHEYAESGEKILDVLAGHRARASFFVTGDFLANTNFAGLIHRIIREGHYLGPHSDKHLLYCSWDHPPKTLVTRSRFTNDVNACLKTIYRLGVAPSKVRFFLPAYENYNAEIASWSSEMGLTLVDYTPGTRSNADYTGEADRNFVSSLKIFDSIIARERSDPAGLDGFILLLHIGSGPGRRDKFSARFGELLDYLSAQKYSFVRIDTLLAK